VRVAGYTYANVLQLILFIALWFVPSVNRAFWGTTVQISQLFGVDFELIRAGWSTYQFWK
jgi:hypothetical protein